MNTLQNITEETFVFLISKIFQPRDRDYWVRTQFTQATLTIEIELEQNVRGSLSTPRFIVSVQSKTLSDFKALRAKVNFEISKWQNENESRSGKS